MVIAGAMDGGKNLKYNRVVPIDLDTIPQDEREQALMEFAEGSLGLEECLRAMWGHGLKTQACCAKEKSDYEAAYICMAVGVDVFSFLSVELLSSDMIKLEIDFSKQIIRFGGPREIREKAMHQLAQDIISGKKDNAQAVQSKIGKPLNEEWMTECRIYHMRKAGLSEEEIVLYEKNRIATEALLTKLRDNEETVVSNNSIGKR